MWKSCESGWTFFQKLNDALEEGTKWDARRLELLVLGFDIVDGNLIDDYVYIFEEVTVLNVFENFLI